MGSLPGPRRRKVSTVCIIGAGPSGLAAAKHLLAERCFKQIVIIEQRSRVGGLWNYEATVTHHWRNHSLPLNDPHNGHGQPVWRNQHVEQTSEKGPRRKAVFQSPVYDRLETNIPRELMGFSSLNWPEDCQLFPQHEEVLEYIERYAEDVKSLIKFETQVLDVRLNADETWTVLTRDVSLIGNANETESDFDAVLVANGHFNVPYLPRVPGIKYFHENFPGMIVHSKYYRNPEKYAGKKVIVVGNSASGVDIANQIAAVCKQPLLVSHRSGSINSAAQTGRPEIAEFIVQDRTVKFVDGSMDTDIDAVIYCTGYLYSFPFLESLHAPLIRTGECVENLYQHIFYRPQPTLAFGVLVQKVIPFPMAEAQAAVIARAWSGRLELPDSAQMAAWERRTLEETGGRRKFHVLPFPKDADYLNMLHDWAMSAGPQEINSTHKELRRRRMSCNSWEHPADNADPRVTTGGTPPHWSEKEYWMRERFPQIKAAFQGFGDQRHDKRRLEDVGFDFAAWKREQIAGDKRML